MLAQTVRPGFTPGDLVADASAAIAEPPADTVKAVETTCADAAVR